jgi:anti-sigma factor RsiW
MRCKQARRYLSEYLDQELPSRLCRRIENHLEVCADCAREYLKLKAIRTLTRNVLIEDPGPHFYSQVSSRLRENRATRPAQRRRLLGAWSLIPMPAKALVTAGLVCLLFFVLVYPHLVTPTLSIEDFQQEYVRSRDVLPWGEQPSATIISFHSGRG